jgi:uncharacterized protein YbcI
MSFGDGASQSPSVHAAISRLIVQAMREYSGRGPTSASTTIGKNSIHCVLGDTLTQPERTLADAGYEEHVLSNRRLLQDVMRPHLVIEIEKLTGRKVVAFLSDNHIGPDVAVESFVLEPVSTEDDGAEG